MRPGLLASLAAACLSLPHPTAAAPRLFADVESGWAVSGYNDVRIPNATGTTFSLSEGDLSTAPAPYFRVRLGVRLGERHTVYLTGAPLRLDARGTLSSDVSFAGATFPADAFVIGRYRFDTWRLTYRYTWWSSESLEATVGLTGLVRDAGITLSGGGAFAEKLNTGFVPLLSVGVLWRLGGPWSLVLDADALAGGPGRAEDVALALRYQVKEGLGVRAGYRFVEGGSDVDEVYNFALVHLLGVGLDVSF